MKKNTFLFIPLITTALLLGCAGNEADRDAASTDLLTDNSPVVTPGNADSPAAIDTSFANKAAISGLAEVALGKLAATKGNSPEVKNFGKMMVTDHTKANQELASVAQSKKLILPTTLDAQHQAKSDSLSKLSGKAFDEAYIKTMKEAHSRALAIMNHQATGGQDVELKAFAVKTAPVIKHHLDELSKLK